MALTKATISGPILGPDGETRLNVKVAIRAVAVNGTVKSTEPGGAVLAGEKTAQSANDGTLSVTLPLLPQANVAPADARWQATFTLLDFVNRRGSKPETLAPIVFELAGATTWAALVDVSGVPVTESILAQANVARDEAVAAAADAEAAKVAAQAVGTTNDTVIAGRINDPASATAVALAGKTADEIEAGALATRSPSTVALRHNFAAAANTSNGTIGTPDVGPGGAWTLSGPGVATARILSGQFVSPSAVTYAYKVLASTPKTVRVRNVWSGSSGPTVALISQATLDIATMSGLHIQTTKTGLNPFIFDGGVLRQPEFSNGGAFALADGVEYETRVDVFLTENVYICTVTRVSDGAVMGQSTSYDPEVSTLTGPLVFIEPGANVGYTFVESYTPAAVAAVQHVDAPRGLTGVIGAVRRVLGLFSRVGVGTAAPLFDLHVVSTSDTPAAVQGSNASGSFLRVISTTASKVGIELRANGASQGPRLYQQNTTNEFRLANHLGTDALEILGSSSAAIKALRNFYPPTPGASNVPTGQTACGLTAGVGAPVNANGADGQLYFRSDGGSLTTIYQRRSGTWVGIV